MNREEIKQTLKILSVAYPKAYKEMSLEDKQLMVSLWEMQFAKEPKDVVGEALNNYIAENEYLPTIAGLKKHIDAVKAKRKSNAPQLEAPQIEAIPMPEEIRKKFKRVMEKMEVV